MAATTISCYNNGTDEKHKLAYYHNPGIEPLRMITLGQLLDEAAEKWPQRNAIISHHEMKKLTYQQAKHQAEQMGAGLLKLGLKPGDRIALLGVNTVHWYIAMLAAAKAGMVVVFLNPGNVTEEMRSALNNVSVKAIITDHMFKTNNYYHMLTEIAPGMSSAPHGQPVSFSELGDLSFIIVATQEKLPGCYRLQDIPNIATDIEELRAIENKIMPDDPAFIHFSSGSTGVQKGIVLSHFGTINNIIVTGRQMGLNEKGSSICLQVPFHHIFGSSYGIMCGLQYGNTIIVPGPIYNRFKTIEILENYKCNILYGTPTMFLDVCNESKNLLGKSQALREGCASIKLIMCGASFCSTNLIQEMSELFPNSRIINAYGTTETCGVITMQLKSNSLDKEAKIVCHITEHTEVMIVDSDGKIVNFGTPGELWVRSFGNLLEYWKNEEKTKESTTKAGWFKTGDIMVLREDGCGMVVGRLKDIIIRGGENIFPAEIEDFLLQHPSISNAQVYGVADERMGEEVAASIKLHESHNLTEANIKEYCKGKISHFKIPKYVRFVQDYPYTESGKIIKYKLKEIHEKELNL